MYENVVEGNTSSCHKFQLAHLTDKKYKKLINCFEECFFRLPNSLRGSCFLYDFIGLDPPVILDTFIVNDDLCYYG